MEENKYVQALAMYDTSLDDAQVKKTVSNILKNLPENNTPEVMKFLFSCIELTSLKTTDSEETVMALTEKVNRFDEEYRELPHVATICVYQGRCNRDRYRDERGPFPARGLRDGVR